MPFKGDRRLGGPRRNDSTLDGMTEGPDFPAEGTILRQESGLQWPVASGGPTAVYNGNSYPTKYGTYNVKADGIGGEYVDFSVAFSSSFYAQGTYVATLGTDVPSYFTIHENSYQNGIAEQALAHDGFGGLIVVLQNQQYFVSGTQFHSHSQEITSTFNDSSYAVGYGTLFYYHSGDGGYYTSLSFVNYTSQGIVVGSYTSSNSLTIVVDGTPYIVSNGTNNNNIVTNGQGGLQSEWANSSYPASGTILLTAGSLTYIADGYGGYNGYPANGMATGSSSSGTNYIEINGTSYENGTYFSTEYHNGTGGYYYTTTRTYKPNGESLGSYYAGQDEYGNNIWGTYYSDGNGGYYT
jgi:hypothetical protein